MTPEDKETIDEYCMLGIALHGLRIKSLIAKDEELASLNEAMSRLLSQLLGILQSRFLASLSPEARSYLVAKMPEVLSPMAGVDSKTTKDT